MNRLIPCASLALLLGLSGCGVSTTKNVEVDRHSGGFLGLGEQADLQTSGLEAMKGETRVVIPNFKVGFYLDKSPGGFKSGSGDAAIVRSKLSGVENADFQAITDAAYAAFKQQLTAQGFSVMSEAEMAALPRYAAAKAKANPEMDKALFGPDALYFVPTGVKHLDVGMFDKGLFNMDMLKQSQATVMDVTLYVTYLGQKLEKVLTMVSGVQVGQAMTVIPGSVVTASGYQASKCVGFCPNTVASVRLGQPIYSTEETGTLTDVTTAGDRALDVAKMAATWMTGGLKTQVTKVYELKADPAKFKKVAIETLGKATGQMAAKLGSGR
ncbi:hypothetical protein [Magnetofaba australis]|uniref:Lipoprotein n=1 Tax=Magnetofaba australis IT-1 TaxID=1434232 RepID=A0A1Y2K8G2_9PROT|nr:hypothetical protein [Magnetofaba australis]OSM07013.1 hypothetical protein MAIT1_00081 [Magnetofaba australis IT-1]